MATIRRMGLALILSLSVAALMPETAVAAGCGSACEPREAPQCMACRFTFLTRTMCARASCELCYEDYCWVAQPAKQGERLAAGTPQICKPEENGGAAGSLSSVPESPAAPKILRVQVLPARS